TNQMSTGQTIIIISVYALATLIATGWLVRKQSELQKLSPTGYEFSTKSISYMFLLGIFVGVTLGVYTYCICGTDSCTLWSWYRTILFCAVPIAVAVTVFYTWSNQLDQITNNKLISSS